MNFDKVGHDDLITGLYRFTPVFTIFRNSMSERILIHLVEIESEVSEKSKEKIVTYIKRKTSSKGKAN